jgi:hypothetical protein
MMGIDLNPWDLLQVNQHIWWSSTSDLERILGEAF